MFLWFQDDDDDDDVVITNTSGLDQMHSSQRRKNIRSIIGTKQLSITTQQAEAQEKARKKRVKEQQELVSYISEENHLRLNS